MTAGAASNSSRRLWWWVEGWALRVGIGMPTNTRIILCQYAWLHAVTKRALLRHFDFTITENFVKGQVQCFSMQV